MFYGRVPDEATSQVPLPGGGDILNHHTTMNGMILNRFAWAARPEGRVFNNLSIADTVEGRKDL